MKKDYFLNQLYNPEFSPGDFLSVGLNSFNTTIKGENDYKNLEEVLNNELFLTNGSFDEQKFSNFYKLALVGYNMISLADYNLLLAKSYSVFRDDIFSKSGIKNNDSETIITKIANPNKQTIGFVNNNIKEAPTKSVREIAEDRFTWNGHKWIDAPNDTPFKNFFEPKVLAQWEFDADIDGNPTTDKDKIAYKKGEKKIDPILGTYYFETLNGRDIYGREVLSGWDTLTKDGTKLNKYDFFDSDDLDKSTTGTLFKSAFKIAPALIPQIAPYYITLRLLLSMGDLSAKVGKMTTGSDSPTLSLLEGVNQAFTMSKSDYALGSSEYGIDSHPWQLESILDLGADVFTQLAEQRWIFKASGLLRGNNLISKESQEAYKNKLFLKYLKEFKGESVGGGIEESLNISTSAMAEATAALERELKSSSDLGARISKLYMTGITVSDSYAEAKESGLNDTEAAIFTAMYALGEYGILSTNLGEHILPELRADKIRRLNALKKLASVSEKESKDTRKWYQKIANLAKESAIGDYNDAKIAKSLISGSTTKAYGLMVASNALGEGLEEVSEELLLDISKSLYNAASDLGITSTGKSLKAWDDGDFSQLISRYGLNFVGGLLGGGIAVFEPTFKTSMKSMLGTNMSKTEAFQEVAALIRNGEKNSLIKAIDKNNFGDKNLSATKGKVVNKEWVWEAGTEEDNQDLATKNVLKQTLNIIDSILTSNKIKIDDESVMKLVSLDAKNLIKLQTILNGDDTSIIASYPQRFNTLASEIVATNLKIEALQSSLTDTKKTLSETEQKELNLLNEKLSDLTKMRDKYLNGEMAKEVIPKVLFELSSFISSPYMTTNFKEYVRKVEGKLLSEVSQERLAELKKDWENYKTIGYVDDFNEAYSYFSMVMTNFSKQLEEFLKEGHFENANYNFDKVLGQIFTNIESNVFNLNEAEDVQLNVQSYIQTEGISKYPELLRKLITLSNLLRDMLYYTNDTAFLKKAETTVNELMKASKVEELSTETLAELESINPSINLSEEKNFNNARETYIKRLLQNILKNNSDLVKSSLLESPYMNHTTKEYLKEFLLNVKDEESGDDIDEEGDILYSEYVSLINGKLNSPIDKLADMFLLAIGDNSFKISELINVLLRLVDKKANFGKIEEFGFDSNIEELLNHALQVLQLMEAHVLASRNDGAKIGNVFGFSATVNELNPDAKLIEIDKNTANTLVYDINLLRNKIYFFKNLFDINSGQKLLELKKLYIKFNNVFVLKIRSFVGAFPDDWEGIEELNTLLGEIDTSKEVLSDEEAISYEKSVINILDALYNIFLKNSDKDLSVLFKHLTLLPASKDSEYVNGTDINSDIKGIDDRTFVWLLATSAAMKASSFYLEYKESITSNRFAPIIGLEIATKMSLAFLSNKLIFLKFADAYNNKLSEEIGNVSESLSREYLDNYNKYVSSEFGRDNSYAILFLHSIVIEGIPGAGKSSGFYSTLFKILDKYHKDIISNVWIIHTDEKKAEKLAESIGLSNTQHFSKESYLQKISSSYTVPTYINGVIQESIDNLNKDENQIYHYKEEDLREDIELPSLVIIDEGTRFSQLEALLSDKFLGHFGKSAIITGDYDQIGAIGKIKTESSANLYLNTDVNNFIHTPKLATSMRTENTIKDTNLNELRKRSELMIRSLQATGTCSQTNLSYYQDDTGLYGEKIVENVEPELDALVNSLREGEQINVIYYSEDSDFYKNLKHLVDNTERYKNKFKFVTTSVSQGLEAQYYIVEAPRINIGSLNLYPNIFGNHAQFIKSLYTAISRSTQGTLILKTNNVVTTLTNTRVQNIIKSGFSENSITEFSNWRKNLLDKSVDDSTTGIEFKTLPNINRKSTSPSSKFDPDSEEETNNLNNENVKSKIKLDNEGKAYNILLHSSVVLESGFELDSSTGLLKPSKYADDRIDGLNGLMKLPNIKIKTASGEEIDLTRLKQTFSNITSPIELKNCLRILNGIAQAGLNLEDKEEISNRIKELLKLNAEKVGVDFVFMTRSTDSNFFESKKGKFKRFIRGIERLVGLYTPKNKEALKNASQDKYFAMNVYYVENGKLKTFLTVPLAIFTSPLTMLNTPGFEHLRTIFYIEANKDINTMISLLEGKYKGTKNADKLLKSFKIWTYKLRKGDVIVYLKDTLRSMAKFSTGPNITSKERGDEYFFSEEYYYDGEYINISEIDTDVHTVSRVYYTTDDVRDSQGNLLIKKGHSFVLVSDYYDNKDELLQRFCEDEISNSKHLTSVIYVSPPKVSVADYFRNFVLKFHSSKRKEIDPTVGNEFSELRIALHITKEGSSFDTYLRGLIENNPNNSTNALEQWELFQNIIKGLDLENKSVDLILSMLQNNLPENLQYLTSSLLKYNVYFRGDSNKYNLKNFISNMLLKFVIEQLDDGFITEIPWTSNKELNIEKIKNNIEAVTLSLPNKMLEGIFIRLVGLLSNGSSHEYLGNTFVEVDADNDYKVSISLKVDESTSRDIRSNGKIDSTILFIEDANEIMDLIIEVMESPEGSELRNKHLNHYFNGINEKEEAFIPNNLINKSFAESLLKDETITSFLDFELAISNKGYNIAKIGNDILVFKLAPGWKLLGKTLILYNGNIYKLIDNNAILQDFDINTFENIINDELSFLTPEELKIVDNIRSFKNPTGNFDSEDENIFNLLIKSSDIQTFVISNLYKDMAELSNEEKLNLFESDIKSYIQNKVKDNITENFFIEYLENEFIEDSIDGEVKKFFDAVERLAKNNIEGNCIG